MNFRKEVRAQTKELSLLKLIINMVNLKPCTSFCMELPMI